MYMTFGSNTSQFICVLYFDIPYPYIKQVYTVMWTVVDNSDRPKTHSSTTATASRRGGDRERSVISLAYLHLALINGLTRKNIVFVHLYFSLQYARMIDNKRKLGFEVANIEKKY